MRAMPELIRISFSVNDTVINLGFFCAKYMDGGENR